MTWRTRVGAFQTAPLANWGCRRGRYEGQHLFHELGFGGVKTMRLDIYDHFVAFSDFHDLAIRSFHHFESLFVGEALGGEAVVGGVDVIAAGQVRPADGVGGIFHTQRGAFRQG